MPCPIEQATDQYHAELERNARSLDDYLKQHFPHTDLDDLTEALACYGTNELIDAFRKGDRETFYACCEKAVNEMFRWRWDGE